MILFVCSQGRIRSRTAEVLALLGGLDARSCGTDSDALVPLTPNLLWPADVVVCMERHHANKVAGFMAAEGKRMVSLGIEDVWNPFDPQLIEQLVSAIRLQTEEAGGVGKDFIAHMLQTLAQAPEVQVVGYLSEAWMSQATKGANVTNLRPSEDPNRTECVIITLMSADCQALQICPIGRNEDTVNVTVTEMQFDRPENPLQGRFVRPRHVN